LTSLPIDGRIQAHKRRKRKEKMILYRTVTLNPCAVAVEMLTMGGWQQVMSFSGISPQKQADRWIAHQMRLDRQDNA